MNHCKFTGLTAPLYQYLLDVSKPLSATLGAMALSNENHPQIQMQIASDQALFLQFLIKTKSMRDILELGTFLGFSTAAMAEALPEQGLVTTCDQDLKTTEYARQQWEKYQFSTKIKSLVGPALTSMNMLVGEQKQFDLIFIDADKRNYPQYYQLAKKLLKPTGIIAVDNTLFHGEVLQPNPSKAAAAIHALNLIIKEDPEVESVVLPIADGLTLIQFKGYSYAKS